MSEKFAIYRREWFDGPAGIRRDVLAGIVVALALIPEAIGFSIIAGVDPRVGLYASVAIAMVEGSFKERLVGELRLMVWMAPMSALVAAATLTSVLSAITWVAVGVPLQVGVSFTPLVIMTLSCTRTNDAGSAPDDGAELADGAPVTGGVVGVGVHPDPRAATRASTARAGEHRRFRT